jgi:transposase
MLSFIEFISESLHKDSEDHEFLGYKTKQELENHYDKIRQHHGEYHEKRHREQDADEVAKKRHKLVHKEPTHKLTVTIVNNFRKIPAGTKVTQYMNKTGVYTIRDGQHAGTSVKAKEHQVERLK